MITNYDKQLLIILLTILTVNISAQTIIQSNTGIGCSTVCINGKCTSTCDESSTSSDNDMEVIKGNGQPGERSYDLGNFDSIISTDINTHVSYDEEYSITVHADSNLLNMVVFSNQGGLLDIKLKPGFYQDTMVEVRVKTPQMKSITQNGTAKLEIYGFDQEEMAIISYGAGEISGAQNQIHDLSLRNDGAGSVNLLKSKVNNADVNITGTSEIKLAFARPYGRLSGEIQGVSELQYCGQPENTIQVSGVADVIQIACD